MIVDSHVNLHGEKFADDLDETILRAREAGVGPMLNICCHLQDFLLTALIQEICMKKGGIISILLHFSCSLNCI